VKFIVNVPPEQVDGRTGCDPRSARRRCRDDPSANETRKNCNEDHTHAHLDRSLRLTTLRIKPPDDRLLAWASVLG
jgi:hypothetical protein